MRLSVVMALVLCAACSKDNEVDANKSVGTSIGAQCSGASDPGCGTQAVCVLGYCRLGCTTDSECPQGALCLGTAPPYGCSLASELSCDSTPCKPPLSCGLDKKCRFGCTNDSDCPRNEHVCLAGTCVSKTENGADKTWLSCNQQMGNSAIFPSGVACTAKPGEDFTALEVCNVIAPGWAKFKDCACGPVFTQVAGELFTGGYCKCGPLVDQVDCKFAEDACMEDAACFACLFEAYTAACDQLPIYKALSTCGCTDAGTPPASCYECAFSWSTCDPSGMGCDQWKTSNPTLWDKCEKCFMGGMNVDACLAPELAALMACLCVQTACSTQCAIQCTAVSKGSDAGTPDASSPGDAGPYHTCSNPGDCDTANAQHCSDPANLGFSICWDCLQPEECTTPQTCVDYVCQ